MAMTIGFRVTAAIILASIWAAHGAAKESKPSDPLLRVLSFNINALPSAIHGDGSEKYARIAEILRQRRQEGTHPQIVLLQEAFDGDARVIADTTGYAYAVMGPGRKDASKMGETHWSPKTRKAYTSFDDPQKLTGSGLVILSDFPILEAQHKAFDSDMCAGIDCLSNKAILLARLSVPGMDRPLDVINSHFNSLNSTKAPRRWTEKAHRRQSDTLEWFLGKVGQGNPLLLAGDFNTRAQDRYRYFRDAVQVQDVAEQCLSLSERCELEVGTSQSAVLYDTNDKQFSNDSTCHRLTPVRISRNFTEQIDGQPLSDHLGYEVAYRVERVGHDDGPSTEALWRTTDTADMD